MNITNFADSSIMSLGLKADSKMIFDLEKYPEIPDKVRGAAFKVLIEDNWTEQGIKLLIKTITNNENIVDITFDTLKTLSQLVELQQGE